LLHSPFRNQLYPHAKARSRYRLKRFREGSCRRGTEGRNSDRRTVEADGLQHRDVRYYERISLIPAPARSAGHYRVYETADVQRLAFIRRARELGFTLDEVRTLLALSANDAQGAYAEVRELAASHLAEVRAKIADLRAIERVLADAVRRCAAGELPGCPVIEALSVA
jgi:MerR family transcriptional regulator, mercuric resistance operon regulatory protein